MVGNGSRSFGGHLGSGPSIKAVVNSCWQQVLTVTIGLWVAAIERAVSAGDKKVSSEATDRSMNCNTIPGALLNCLLMRALSVLGGDLGGSVVSMLVCELTGRRFECASHLKTDHPDFPPVVYDSIFKSLCLWEPCLWDWTYKRCPLSKKSTGSCASGRSAAGG